MVYREATGWDVRFANEITETEPPSEEELENSRSYILGSFVRNRETPQQVASDLWLIEWFSSLIT